MLLYEMKKTILILTLLFLFLGVSFYIAQQIESYNMSFYLGKDNGVFAQFESIVIMSIIFNLALYSKNILRTIWFGLWSGILAGIVGYLLFLSDIIFSEKIIVYPVYSIIIFVSIYLVRNMYQTTLKKKTIPLSRKQKSSCEYCNDYEVLQFHNENHWNEFDLELSKKLSRNTMKYINTEQDGIPDKDGEEVTYECTSCKKLWKLKEPNSNYGGGYFTLK